MQQKEFIIKDKIGVHARPAGQLMLEIKKWKSQFEIKFNGGTTNLASPISVLSMGIVYNSSVIISANGPDEEIAFPSVIKWMKGNGII